jgi:uncharacterized damage-inducible protein DinB
MSAVPPWFERKFEFSFPTTHYQNVLVRLHGTPARLEEIFRDVSPERRVCRPGPNKWSAQEHAGHLLDLEPLWFARVEDFLGAGTVLTAADLSNRKTHDANHNARMLEEILVGFSGARRELLNRVGKLALEMFSRTMMHPRLQQPMRLVDHLYFVAEHDDHHLATIWELAK